MPKIPFAVHHKWFGLITVSLGMFLGALDLSVNVALPAITESFGSEMSTVQWIIILYIGTTTGLQLTIGRLADTYGLKRFYVLGVGIYTLAVTLIGLSTNFDIALGFRIVQAIGYAMIMATSPALVAQMFDDTARGRALGTMTSIGTLGMISATLGGGLLVEQFGWSAIFLARLPFGVIAFGLACYVLQELPPKGPRSGPNLGAATALFIGISAVVLILNLIGRLGWEHVSVLSLILLAFVSLALFYRSDKKAPNRILQLDFLTPTAVKALLAAFLMTTGSFINLFLLPYFLSDILGSGASALGLLLMLAPVVAAVAAPVAGFLSDRHPPSWIATWALMIIAVSIFTFTRLGEQSSAFDVGIRLSLFGAGLGAFQASNMSSLMKEVPSNRLGMSSALLAFAFSLGMVTSVGLMNAIFSSFLDHASQTMLERQAFLSAFSKTYLTATIILGLGVIVSAPWGNLFRTRLQ